VRASLSLFCLAEAVLIQAAGALGAQSPDTLIVEPVRAETGFFYRGVRLTVSGVVDSGAAVAVLVSGPRSDLHLRTETQVGGLFWAPSGEVTFRNVPTLYLLRTSAGLGEQASGAMLRNLGVGYAALRAVVLSAHDRDDLFAELIRLKESEGLFQARVSELQFREAPGGRQGVTTVFTLPPNAPAVTYLVQLFAFRDQRLTSFERASFTLDEGWLPGFIGSLAQHRGVLYGVLAVVSAVVAGLLVGLVAGSIKET
jgi:hypothetical protein